MSVCRTAGRTGRQGTAVANDRRHNRSVATPATPGHDEQALPYHAAPASTSEPTSERGAALLTSRFTSLQRCRRRSDATTEKTTAEVSGRGGGGGTTTKWAAGAGRAIYMPLRSYSPPPSSFPDI